MSDDQIEKSADEIKFVIGQITRTLRGCDLRLSLAALTMCMGYGLLNMPRRARAEARAVLIKSLDMMLKTHDEAERPKQ
jgi:hypothetical protein